MDLMEEILADENLQEALRKVCANKGAAGIDGITMTEFHKQMSEEWKETKQRLLLGKYKPKGVRRVEIPKLAGDKNARNPNSHGQIYPTSNVTAANADIRP